MQVIPLAETLAAVEPAMPASLIPAQARARAQSCAANLPAALASILYLESRLAAERTQVDLILGIGEQGRAILAGENPAITLPDRLREHQVWAGVAQLCRQWGDTSSPLHRGIDRIWLELDLHSQQDATMAGAPVPGIFIDFIGRGQETAPDPLELTRCLLAAVDPGGLAGWGGHPVHRCMALLPAGAWVPYVGIFPGRSLETATIRFCVRGLDRQRRREYLQALAWPGTGQLDRFTGTIAEHWNAGADRRAVVLHLDVGAAGVGDRIGLEYYLERLPQLHGTAVEERFLAHLVQLGLCTTGKQQGLQQWPGYEVRRLAHELWPSLLTRWVNHVKLVHDHHRSVEAKAYLYLAHRPHSRSAEADQATVRAQELART